ncbi:uncharacterized protein LOC144798733 isoform X2 [Lissotriton helveticus]
MEEGGVCCPESSPPSIQNSDSFEELFESFDFSSDEECKEKEAWRPESTTPSMQNTDSLEELFDSIDFSSEDESKEKEVCDTVVGTVTLLDSDSADSLSDDLDSRHEQGTNSVTEVCAPIESELTLLDLYSTNILCDILDTGPEEGTNNGKEVYCSLESELALLDIESADNLSEIVEISPGKERNSGRVVWVRGESTSTLLDIESTDTQSEVVDRGKDQETNNQKEEFGPLASTSTLLYINSTVNLSRVVDARTDERRKKGKEVNGPLGSELTLLDIDSAYSLSEILDFRHEEEMNSGKALYGSGESTPTLLEIDSTDSLSEIMDTVKDEGTKNEKEMALESGGENWSVSPMEDTGSRESGPLDSTSTLLDISSTVNLSKVWDARTDERMKKGNEVNGPLGSELNLLDIDSTDNPSEIMDIKPEEKANNGKVNNGPEKFERICINQDDLPCAEPHTHLSVSKEQLNILVKCKKGQGYLENEGENAYPEWEESEATSSISTVSTPKKHQNNGPENFERTCINKDDLPCAEPHTHLSVSKEQLNIVNNGPENFERTCINKDDLPCAEPHTHLSVSKEQLNIVVKRKKGQGYLENEGENVYPEWEESVATSPISTVSTPKKHQDGSENLIQADLPKSDSQANLHDQEEEFDVVGKYEEAQSYTESEEENAHCFHEQSETSEPSIKNNTPENNQGFVLFIELNIHPTVVIPRADDNVIDITDDGDLTKEEEDLEESAMKCFSFNCVSKRIHNFLKHPHVRNRNNTVDNKQARRDRRSPHSGKNRVVPM